MFRLHSMTNLGLGRWMHRAVTLSVGVMLLARVIWRQIGPGDAPRRLGCNCGGALAVLEAEKVRILGEVFRSQKTPRTQTVLTMSI